MSGDSIRTALLGMVNDKIDPIKRKCRANKRRFQWLTAGSIIFSAAITLTLGFDLPEHVSGQKNTALLFGMALTLINGWLAIFDYKKLWIRQKSTLFGLYQLENELKFLTDSPHDQERVKILFKSYQELWERDGNEWENILSTSSPDNN